MQTSLASIISTLLSIVALADASPIALAGKTQTVTLTDGSVITQAASNPLPTMFLMRAHYGDYYETQIDNCRQEILRETGRDWCHQYIVSMSTGGGQAEAQETTQSLPAAPSPPTATSPMSNEGKPDDSKLELRSVVESESESYGLAQIRQRYSADIIVAACQHFVHSIAD